jgi:hypothetical protein
VHTRPLLLADKPIERFLVLSDGLFATTGQPHRIALDRLYTLVCDGLVTLFRIDTDTAREVLSRDYLETGARGSPKFLTQLPAVTATSTGAKSAPGTTQRQARHRRA